MKQLQKTPDFVVVAVVVVVVVVVFVVVRRAHPEDVCWLNKSNRTTTLLKWTFWDILR